MKTRRVFAPGRGNDENARRFRPPQGQRCDIFRRLGYNGGMRVRSGKRRGELALEQCRLIGLTGLYCAGKNYAAGIFEKRGIPVLDVDKAGHEAIVAKKTEIAARFGEDILDGGGEIDRKKLGAKVFGKPEEMRALEAIVHPEANRIANAWIAAHEGMPVIINAALLHKCDCFDRLDAIIIIHAPFLVRLRRAKRRDALPLGQLIRRLMSQKAFTAQYFRKNADTRIKEIANCGSGMEKKLSNVRFS
jgi:dephospho-CoA kinase